MNIPISSFKIERRPYYQSSSFVMAIIFTQLLGVSVFFICYSLYDLAQQNFAKEAGEDIQIELDRLLVKIDGQPPEKIIATVQSEMQERAHLFYYFYKNTAEKRLAGNIEVVSKRISPPDMYLYSSQTLHDNKIITVVMKDFTFSDGSRVGIAADIDSLYRFHERLKFFGFMIFIFILLVILISFLISFFVVRQINIIAKTAQEIIKTGDLSKRILTFSRWDDLSNLSHILNTFLHKTEKLMQEICNVTDSVAHDLRTPLNHLRNKLEFTQTKLLSDPYSVKDLKDVIDETDRILSTFNMLLRISSLEKNNFVLPFKRICLNDLLNDIIDYYEPYAEDKNIKICHKQNSTLYIQGEPHSLFQLFANILDNAIKFSLPNTSIEIITKSKKGVNCVSVIDHGTGLPAEEYELVFKKFYRADKSRNTPGNGLGLSHVKAVAEFHGAKIFLNDNNPGLRFTLEFKKDDKSSAFNLKKRKYFLNGNKI